MQNYRTIVGPVTLALLAMGSFMTPGLKSAETGDSAEVTKLLADAKAEAVELKADASDMEGSRARS